MLHLLSSAFLNLNFLFIQIVFITFINMYLSFHSIANGIIQCENQYIGIYIWIVF